METLIVKDTTKCRSVKSLQHGLHRCTICCLKPAFHTCTPARFNTRRRNILNAYFEAVEFSTRIGIGTLLINVFIFPRFDILDMNVINHNNIIVGKCTNIVHFSTTFLHSKIRTSLGTYMFEKVFGKFVNVPKCWVIISMCVLPIGVKFSHYRAQKLSRLYSCARLML